MFSILRPGINDLWALACPLKFKTVPEAEHFCQQYLKDINTKIVHLHYVSWFTEEDDINFCLSNKRTDLQGKW